VDVEHGISHRDPRAVAQHQRRFGFGTLDAKYAVGIVAIFENTLSLPQPAIEAEYGVLEPGGAERKMSCLLRQQRPDSNRECLSR